VKVSLLQFQLLCLKGKIFPTHSFKIEREVKIQLQSFLLSALDRD